MSPEQILHQSHIVFDPEDKTGDVSGQIGPELPQQQEPLSETDQLVSTLEPYAKDLLDLSAERQVAASAEGIQAIKAVRHASWETRGPMPPTIVGDTSDRPLGANKQENDNEESKASSNSDKAHREEYVRVLNLGLNRDSDLSADANRLVYLMLLDEDNVEELRQEFEREGRNFQAAYDELDGHGLLVKSQSGRIHLPYQLIPKKREESNTGET